VTKDGNKKWKRFEKLVAEIQESFAPNAEVTHNDKILGIITKKVRQVDVSLKGNIAQYKILIAIECKDSKIRADLPEIEGFAEKLKDIEANKGVIVSASGFTDSAKTKAKAAGIEIYRLVDTDKHDWQTYVSIPALCDIRSLGKFNFTFRYIGKLPSIITTLNARTLLLYADNGSVIDSVINLLAKKWNEGFLPKEPGIYKGIKLADNSTYLKLETSFYRIDVFVNIEVRRNLYFGQLPIEKIKGFRDEQTGGVITHGFETGTLKMIDVEEKWQKIESEKDLAVLPVLTLGFINHYPMLEIKFPQSQENK